MFTIYNNPRISRKPVGFKWGMCHPDHIDTVHSIDDSLNHMRKTALGLNSYRADMHRLSAIVWEDGSFSWAHFCWSIWNGQLTIYVQSPTGSELMTVKCTAAF